MECRSVRIARPVQGKRGAGDFITGTPAKGGRCANFDECSTPLRARGDRRARGAAAAVCNRSNRRQKDLFFNTHYQVIDVEPPLRFDLTDPKRTDLWGMPAVERWFYEPSEFVGRSTPAPNARSILSERATAKRAAAN